MDLDRGVSTQDTEGSNLLNAGCVVVIIEELRRIHAPLLVWHRLRGHSLYYLRKGPGLRGGLASLLLNWSRIEPLTDKPLVYIRANSSGDLAYETVEQVYGTYFKNHPCISALVDGFQSDELHLAFRKMLTEELEDFYYYNLLFARIIETCGHRTTVFVVPDALQKCCAYECSLSLIRGVGLEPASVPTVFFHSGVRILAPIARLVKRCLYVLYLMYCLIAARLGQVCKRRSVPWEAEYGITIMSSLREFSDDLNGIGFLLDHDRIAPGNTLFIAQCRLSQRDLVELRRRGYRCLSLHDLRTGADWSVFMEGISLMLGGGFRGPEWILRTAVVVIRELAWWRGFLRHGRLRHLISYCDFGTRHIPRNVALKEAGVQTWYYADTTNQSGNWGIPQHRAGYWGFLFYDNYVAWNRGNSLYQQMHKQRIGRYHEVGILWSESVRLICEGMITPAVYQQLQHRIKSLRGGDRIIAVFDSSFNNYTVTTYAQAVEFAQDVYRLLTDRPDVIVIFKEKKPRSIHRGWQDSMGLEEIYSLLEQHSRCLMVGHHVSRAIVIALAHLTISFPFTSTTLEALGAGRRAIYYDPTSDFHSTCYAAIPGLTVHDYKELVARVDELLYKTSDEEYREYMERESKGTIDPYLDGMAITRFRRLLAEGTR